MGGDRHCIDILFIHIHGNFADRLRRIGMENHPTLAAELTDFSDWLQHANLVVSSHDCHQDGFVINGALQFVKINQPIFMHGQVGDAEAVLLQSLAGIQHCLMLSHSGDDVVTFFLVHLGHTLDGEVVALGGA